MDTAFIRIALAVVAGIFLWFFITATFGATPESDNTKALLGVAAYGFAMAALLPWPVFPNRV